MLAGKLLARLQNGQNVGIRMYMGTMSATQEKNPFNYVDNFDVSQYKSHYGIPQEAWVETLKTPEGENLRIKNLHEDVFSVHPRIDFIHENVKWQRTYNKINYNHVLNVKEMIHWHGGGAKPWQQKGTGRARHGSTRSPQWVQGGKVFGPKAPKSHYYMIPFSMRVYGLTHTLTVKYLQDDVHVVDNLDIPTDDPEFLKELISTRGWGKSTLFVDTADLFPKNITAATEDVKWFNLMPVYGLNVISMLKHETLVLTEAAVDDITRKLLFALNRTDSLDRTRRNITGPEEQTLKLEQHRPVV